MFGNKGKLHAFFFGGLLLMVALISGCATHPYNEDFSCPPTYGGLCESMPEAYEDSVYDIDPRQFDEKWLKKRREWEKKNVKLLMARQAAGVDVKTVTPPEELFGKNGNEFNKKEKNPATKGKTKGVRPPTYREMVFEEFKALLSEPEKPFIAPPKVVRVLILSNVTKDNYSDDLYISPLYIYFFLDRPKFLLHKYPERVPFDPENPFIRR